MTVSRQSQATIKNRNIALASKSLVPGITYKDLSKEFGINKGYISRILNKPEIKEILDAGTSELISFTPIAAKVYYDRLTDDDEKLLQFKAAESLLKIDGIIAGNVQNQTVNQVFNIQNNITLNPGVAKALSGLSMQDDPDVIDAETV